MTSSISRLQIENTPLSSASMFSPAAMSYAFSSPSASSSSASDGMLSTPMTIAPSVLSSPNSWDSPPFSDSPALPVILETPLEEHFDEESASHFLHGSELPESQPMISPVLPPSPRAEEALMSLADSPKRKRASPPPGKEAPAVPKPPSKARSRRSPPATSPKAPKSTATRPKKPLPAPKKVKATAVPPAAPKRGVCPLPGRVVKSSRRSTLASFSASAPIFAPESPGTICRPLLLRESLGSDEDSDHEHIHEESDCDDASEYEADRSSDDEDEEFRPYKRTRSSSYPVIPAIDDSSRTRRKARTQKINAAMGLGSGSRRRKSSSSSFTTRRRKGKKEKEPRTPCIFIEICGKDFGRHSDMVRHCNHSCKGNPNKQFAICPICDYVASRNDASLRHKGSDNCRQRLKAKLARLAEEQAEAEAEAAAAAEEEADVVVEPETAEAEVCEQ